MIHQHLGGLGGGGSAKTGEMYFKFLPNVEMRRPLTVNHQMSSKAKGREYQPHMYPNLHHMRISSLSKKLPTLLQSSRHSSKNIPFVGRWGTIWVMIALGGLLRLVGTLSLTLAPDSRSSSLSSPSPSL